ncbi:uncharacterized protein JN550_013697 [Neoarthrinium moseri]|uniref:uncharacterized protein n=1 Tax=Neoarthrinium moseri TaxID=1658444 RepID=UPI001FDDA63A|nr:uncharacterized protein JN550_013697 [Neoarthrinium moseri]KAI1856703.1 hypothetical protein JN550_013697 [Neoarthrinium moseri]
MAVKDIKTWILMFLLFFIIFAASITNFFPSVVETLGYGKVRSLFLTVPPYAIATVLSCLNAWHSDRVAERYWHITIPLCFAVTGFIIAATTESVAPRYLSMILMLSGLYPGFVIALGWISSTVRRPLAKRAAAMALITAFGNSSSIYASFMFQSQMAPRYVLAMSVCSGAIVLALGCTTVLRFVLVHHNKRTEGTGAAGGPAVDFKFPI